MFERIITRFRELQWGFWIGLILFFIILQGNLFPGLTPVQVKMLALAVLMGAWWMTEAVPLFVTALLPLAFYPILGIMKTAEVSPNYGHHLVFLFLGGFIIAIALQEWGLHRRFALRTISLVGNNPRRIVLSFMFSTAALSMWISNTATTIMMLPIALAVIKQIQGEVQEGNPSGTPFGTVLLLGIAYSASVGGIATLIGTPPNLVLSGVYSKYFPDAPEITFVRWMVLALPLSILLFLVIWLYLTRIVLRKKDVPTMSGRDYFIQEYHKLGPMNGAQKRVLLLFFITALLWIFRADLKLGFVTIPGWPNWFGLQGRIQDSTIAIAMAVWYFILPGDEKRDTLLNWKQILNIPWDILLLFGGGFALADGIHKTGLGAYVGHQLQFLAYLPTWVMLFLLALSVALLTEFTSNTAVATTILPILAAASIDMGVQPLIIMIPATVAASCAFMLPVATPPNAIVFGSRYISVKTMVKIGMAVILSASLIVSTYFYLVQKFFL